MPTPPSFPPPEFPGADDVQLPARWMRDLEDLGRSLKFSNPQELMDFWTLFVRRLARTGESFVVTATLNRLLRNIYDNYDAQRRLSARRLDEFRADPRMPPAEIQQLERLYEQQVTYQARIVAVLPNLTRLLIEAAEAALQETPPSGPPENLAG